MSLGLEDTIAAIVREQVALALDEKLPKYFGQTRLPPRGAAAPAVAEYLTIQQVAKAINKSPTTVRRMIKSGEIRPCGPRRDRIACTELRRFMEDPTPKASGENEVEAEATRLRNDAR